MQLVAAADADRVQARIAGALRRLGCSAGDRIGVCLPTSPELLHVVAAALRGSVTPVVVSPLLTQRERAVIVRTADAKMWIDEDVVPRLLDGPAAEIADVPIGRPMHCTSGSSATPKIVWGGALDEAQANRLWAEEIELWAMEGRDVHYACSPLHHSAPLRFALATLVAGGSVAVPQSFDATSSARHLAEVGATTTFCTPTHLRRFAEGGVLGELASLRLVAHAGEPCPTPLKRAAIDAIGAGRLWEFYGSTEGQFTVCASPEWLERPGTVGRARPGRMISVDAAGAVWCTAPAWARWSYWADPQRTAQAWDGDRFTVGDLGRLDDAGYLFLDGRRSDLIISGGINVSPEEVERELAQIDGVVDVVAFARPDERWGQRVCVAVVGDVAVDAVHSAARLRLAPYKRPKEVHRVPAIPRSPAGKVQRRTMAAALGFDDGRDDRHSEEVP